jgi:hypothetical protein
MVRLTAAALVTLSLTGAPAFAADAADALAARAATTVTETAAAPADVDWSMPAVRFGGAPARRPGSLASLYVSLAGLHAFDAYSTLKGVGRGAREANPLLQDAAKNPAVFWTLKAATTAVPLLVAEKLWKKNRAGAVAVMAIANGMAVAVAANNAKVLRHQR